jgi:hypothetical protein
VICGRYAGERVGDANLEERFLASLGMTALVCGMTGWCSGMRSFGIGATMRIGAGWAEDGVTEWEWQSLGMKLIGAQSWSQHAS